MKYFFIVLTVFFTNHLVSAQSTRDSVRAVIQNMFRAMKDADTSVLKSCLSDSVIIQTVEQTKEGSTLVRTENLAGFISQVGKAKPGWLDERISFETVKVDGPLAIAWTPYHFFLNGQFSHCGVNSFQLVRLGRAWKIQYVIDTRRKTGCRR